MNIIKNFLKLFLLSILLFLIFKNNLLIKDSVIYSFNLWLYKLFPSLFIMFILSDIIINSNILHNITFKLNNIFNKIFKLNGNSFDIFIMSIFSGTPTNSYIIKEMYNKNNVDIKSANKLLLFTYFSNPLFLYNILIITFNKYIVLKIIIIHYISNIIIGLLYRDKNISIMNNNYNNKENNNIFLILTNSISKSINTLIMILGTITFYMIISNIIINTFNLNIYLEIIIKGLLEITQSLNILYKINNISIIKEIIAISIISFGGLSIHTQVYQLINDSNVNYKYFLKGRIIHVLISTITYILCSASKIC